MRKPETDRDEDKGKNGYRDYLRDREREKQNSTQTEI